MNIRLQTEPITLTTGTITEIEILGPNRPRPLDTPDERGCHSCGQDAYFSGCEAPGCNGYGCPDCGTGCDIDFLDDEDSSCAQVIAEEAEEDEGDEETER
ncbi:hypothetical protein [Streptomyces sp. OUCMDZ-3434]|uniref:hypothetical protein n=1 Tax=Streptomyces sp. OUCMDZ-3434 TaxID=1535304 RepID=UPI001E531E8B|nr:hypothetical protein [Streptomyces sp. OUCMDZ-3434]